MQKHSRAKNLSRFAPAHFAPAHRARLSIRVLEKLVLALLLVLGGAFSSVPVRAQSGITISYPRSGQAVRGTMKVIFEGVPEGGYAMVYVDLTPDGSRLDSFKGAVTSGSLDINTFPLSDGRHTVTVIGFNSSGKRVGQGEANFEVANSRVDVTAQQVRLLNWTLADRISSSVQRYRVFAESNATMSGGSAMGGGGMGGGMAMSAMGGMGGGAGGASGGAGGSGTPAPLDWQVDLLIRRVVRDVGCWAVRPTSS